MVKVTEYHIKSRDDKTTLPQKDVKTTVKQTPKVGETSEISTTEKEIVNNSTTETNSSTNDSSRSDKKDILKSEGNSKRDEIDK